jgi:hypothetical protein
MDGDCEVGRPAGCRRAGGRRPCHRFRHAQARSIWADDRDALTPLDRLAPAARFPARLDDDRARVIRTTEQLVVSYRRSLAGYRFAVQTGQDGAAVASEFGLGHVSRPEEESDLWAAAGPLTEVLIQ